MSGNKMSCNLKCVARAATLRQAPSRLRLSVRQPRRGCLPWWPKKRTVATFCFKEVLWQQGASGEYEQTAECGMKDLAKLSRLEADLPVKVKYWIKGRPSKALLQVSLGALLDQLESTPASEAWLAFTATGQEQRVCWQPAQHQHGAGAVSDDGLEDSADPPLGYDDLWGSSGESPLEEDLALETPVPCVVEDGEEADGEWETFFNPSNGKTLRLPRHTEEEAAEKLLAHWAWTSLDDLFCPQATAKWRGPGAWTSEDDLLSVRALRIVAGIRPMVKKPRLPEGPQWWEQASSGTAATPVPLPGEGGHQLLTNWNLPAFPGSNAAPCLPDGADAGLPEVPLPAPHRCGGAEAGVPEVPLSAPQRRGEAGRGATRRRRRPFLTIMAALAYLILVKWIVDRGDNMLDHISARVDGWVRMWLIA